MQKGRFALLKLILLIICFSVIPCMALNYTVDPLQYYRKSFYFNNVLYSYQRYQNPGLARNYEYDSIVIGTSMTENFLPRDTKAILGLDMLKLSISAGSAYEQKRMLEFAASAGKVRTVLWGIDFSAFRGEHDRKGAPDSEFPEYMYDSNRVNDVSYLLNDKTTELSITTLIRLIRFGPARKPLDVSRYSFWYPYAKFGETEMRKKGIEFESQNPELWREYDIEQMKQSIETNLFDPISRLPEVDFLVFYTPASVLREKFFDSQGIFDMELEFKMYLNKRLLELPNVNIYDFQAAPEIVLDLNKYSDYSHYDLSVMAYMLECIRDGRYLVKAPDSYIPEHVSLVRD